MQVMKGRMMKKVVVGIMMLGVLALSACSHAPTNTEATKILPGNGLDAAYKLSPGDEIGVNFPYFTDMNQQVTIGPDGTVVLPLVNKIYLAGLSVEQADAKLREAYLKAKLKVNEPESLSVSVKTYSLQQIYVEGQVLSPGVVRSTVPLTLSRAVAQAGGFKFAAAQTSNVLLVRRAPDGSVEYYQIDMSNGVTAPGHDPMLNSYDLVYVPETAIYSASDFIATNLLRLVPFSINHPI